MSGAMNLVLGGSTRGEFYEMTQSNTSVDEGNTVTFSMTGASNPGATLYWEIVSVSGTVDGNDFTNTATSGTFTVANTFPQQFLSKTLVKDFSAAAEGDEQFYIRLRKTNSSGAVVATSSTITIGDTASLSSSAGEVQYTTPGTYSFIPAQTTTYCILCVGGGGGGAIGPGGDGGGGGGLAYLNGYSLTSGTSYTVVVGAGGAGADVDGWGATGNTTTQTANSGIAGGNSYFISATTVQGGGGAAANTSASGRGAGGVGVANASLGTSRGAYAGGPGGYGNATDSWRFDTDADGLWPPTEYLPDAGGGGGAAGYSAVGGSGAAATTTGNSASSTASTGGGGGGGGASPDFAACGGGGVGIWGAGANGGKTLIDANNEPCCWWNGVTYAGGGGGSGGTDGGRSDSQWGGSGGNFGGGGGGSEWCQLFDYIGSGQAGSGGGGAVRIMWGSGRAYPSTGTANT